MSNALQFPFVVYQTQNQFDDYRADDMQCRDINESTLRKSYGLDFIIAGIDPWAGEVYQMPGAFHGFAGGAMTTRKVDRYEMANLLFDQFRKCTFPVSFLGYRRLFLDLVAHFRASDGAPFRHKLLDEAYYDQIVSDTSKKSSLLSIEKVINEYINWSSETYPDNKKDNFKNEIADTVLPKFNRWKDRFNGLSMSVHDVYATCITIKSLQIEQDTWRAVIHYKGQDHFGLDRNDIINLRFHRIPVFRIWFILQRSDRFGYRPFMTNFEATVELKGRRKK